LKKRKSNIVLSFWFIICAVLIMSTCSTIPKNTLEVDRGDFFLLPAGGQLYLWADVSETRPLLESIEYEGLSLAHAATILDRTNTAAAVFGSLKTTTGSTTSGASIGNGASAGNVDKFFISLQGRYPTFQAGFSLTFSRDWKKLRSNTGNSYWFSQGFGVGLALDSQLALVSGGDPFNSIPSIHNQPAASVPDGFDKFREQYRPQGAVMAGWIPDSALINEFLSNFGLPIAIPAEDFFFCVLKEKSGNVDSWDLVFNIRTSSANQARGLVSVFTLARIFISGLSNPGAEKTSLMDFIPSLFANAPQREEATLTLKSDSFSTEELALLFSAVSVYSNTK
jgi:hypothetical protein